MFDFADNGSFTDLSITPVTFFKDQALLAPDASSVVILACGSGSGGCTCGKSGCACFYGTGA